jgi:hypothetical protein
MSSAESLAASWIDFGRASGAAAMHETTWHLARAFGSLLDCC